MSGGICRGSDERSLWLSAGGVNEEAVMFIGKATCTDDILDLACLYKSLIDAVCIDSASDGGIGLLSTYGTSTRA